MMRTMTDSFVIFKIVFIFACAGSFLLHMGFSLVAESRDGSWALGHMASAVGFSPRL